MIRKKANKTPLTQWFALVSLGVTAFTTLTGLRWLSAQEFHSLNGPAQNQWQTPVLIENIDSLRLKSTVAKLVMHDPLPPGTPAQVWWEGPLQLSGTVQNKNRVGVVRLEKSPNVICPDLQACPMPVIHVRMPADANGKLITCPLNNKDRRDNPSSLFEGHHEWRLFDGSPAPTDTVEEFLPVQPTWKGNPPHLSFSLS